MIAKKKLSLFIFIDALGWEILQRHSFLDDLTVKKAPLDTVLGYSSTCIPTILTGKMPRDHLHFSFFYYNLAQSPFGIMRHLKFLPKQFTRLGRVRGMMSKLIKRYYGYSGYFQIYNMPFAYLPLFDYSEKRDLYRPGGINSGSSTIFDALSQRNIQFSVSDWRAAEESNLKLLENELKKGEIRFAYLYLAQLDSIIHAHGTQASVVSRKIQWYDSKIRYILECAEKRYDEVRFFVFSDHGQADVTVDYDLIPKIERLGLRYAKDYVALYDSTMARFWFLEDSARRKISEVLENEKQGRILSDAELIELGCDFPNQLYGQLLFLLHPGAIICPSYMGETHLAAMHGYDPNDKDSAAMIAANVELEPRPRRLDDMYDLMLKEAIS